MNSPNFIFPLRHFPGWVRPADLSVDRVFLFRDTHGDKGLRNAVKVFWNLKKITVTLGGYSFTGPADSIADQYPPASRAAAKVATGHSYEGDETVGMPNCFPAEITYPGASYYGFRMLASPYLATFVLGEIVFVGDADRYGVVLQQYGESWGECYGPGYSFHASLSPTSTCNPTLPQELEPLSDSSPCVYNIISGAPPAWSIEFGWWSY